LLNRALGPPLGPPSRARDMETMLTI